MELQHLILMPVGSYVAAKSKTLNKQRIFSRGNKMTTADEIQTCRTVTHRANSAIRIAAHLVSIAALLAGGTAAQAGDDGGALPQHKSGAKPAGHTKAKAAKVSL